ncbi:protein phosphatase [Shewanella sp. Choline-02u-19]|jgi:chemotaxis protein CheZ|uniref:protein phosphatase CheZ n=1 Tax=Shewanella TaxID=22 RepID=UPI000C327A5F|nr:MULTISPECIES: protein phosphatase CheZ [Shewanella]MCL1057855.1 protein phosphatase CheZ [Shewanella gelidimarina]PKG56572.1 protein phosphatase [Shewanella sp. GutDb-MelDb]PKG75894.1 protein phosphatase [Shewanella sp. GutCb]PKH55697.1 protein phosphatase [Shewanella sp. Bg11-22]PKI26888.1 protein phosphatase [Shewanella sp. Choline-02u-19]
MQQYTSGLITLEQAESLVALLRDGEQAQADELVREIASPIQKELFDEVGRLTRQLHSAIVDFQVDNRLVELANTEIPDAKERLTYVIEMTEQAANKTMDAVEECLPLANALSDNIQAVKPAWDKLMRRELPLNEFKALCHDIQQFVDRSESDASRVRELLNQILLAQDFQDLTGQMIRRVIELVREVESSLVSMLTVFGEQPASIAESTPLLDVEAEGPIMNAEKRQDVVTGQDEVDDLLSSLGF